MTKFQKMFYDIKNTRDYKTIGENIDYKVWVEHENRKIIMQFEESNGTIDKQCSRALYSVDFMAG